jgi:hypothetical protein
MQNFTGLGPVELNDAELAAVSGGFSIGGFNVSLSNSSNTNSLNNSGNVAVSNSIVVAPQIDLNLLISL